MSIFLMGCYNQESRQWCTVTKVSSISTVYSFINNLFLLPLLMDFQYVLVVGAIGSVCNLLPFIGSLGLRRCHPGEDPVHPWSQDDQDQGWLQQGTSVAGLHQADGPGLCGQGPHWLARLGGHRRRVHQGLNHLPESEFGAKIVTPSLFKKQPLCGKKISADIGECLERALINSDKPLLVSY